MRTLVPLAALVVAVGAVWPRGPERIRVSDNDRPAGTLKHGVLSLRLDVRTGMWYPDGDRATGALVPAFGEVGKRPQIPGPMIRVPAGTEVVARVTNSLASETLTLYGLGARPIGAGSLDAIPLVPGESREVRFRLDAPGTYYYWGTTMGRSFLARTKEDAQLSGAIIVDPPGADPKRDRVLVIGLWSDTTPTELSRTSRMQRALLTINGRSWPHTTRLDYTVGDSVRFRVINATPVVHPMHLHGFYFAVDSRGDGRGDTIFAADRRDFVVTERVPIGATMTMSWIPERAGNWVFHCHIPEHFTARGPLGVRPPGWSRTVSHSQHADRHALEGMGGLVVGVHVSPRKGSATYAAGEPARRRMRLLVRANGGGSSAEPFYEFALHEGGAEPPPDTGLRTGPPIVLTRGEPVSITIVNRLTEATAVHWHGIELQSYFDGVAGFSGDPRRLSPAVAPADSFEVRFAPPRAGTFIYHTHLDEIRQQRAGLAGPLIVLEPGRRFDPATDIPVLITSPSDSAAEEDAALINGELHPAPLAWRVGTAYRLRFINITVGRAAPFFELRRDTSLIRWRIIAKDGADLPPARRVERPARMPVAIGETMDVEVTPTEPGPLRFVLRTALGRVIGAWEMRVE